MAKKKKTQLKPVQRTFATTSIPKKQVPTTEETEEVDEGTATNQDSSAGHSSMNPSGTKDSVEDTISPLEMKLQEIVSRLQEKTDKEVGRSIQV